MRHVSDPMLDLSRPAMFDTGDLGGELQDGENF